MERVDRLERPQCRIELRGMAVEGIEGRLDAFLLVALLCDGQILDARQRLARRPSGRCRPGFLAHAVQYAALLAVYPAASAFRSPRTAHRAKPPASARESANAASDRAGSAERKPRPGRRRAVSGSTRRAASLH